MRLPEEANRWKSDGRIIELDTGDQAVRQIGEGHDPSAPTFAAWLHGHGWTVTTWGSHADRREDGRRRRRCCGARTTGILWVVFGQLLVILLVQKSRGAVLITAYG